MTDLTDDSNVAAAPAAATETKADTARVPKSDAEAALMEADAATAAKPAEEKPATPNPEDERRRNRTTEYIGRLKSELQELREYRQKHEASQVQPDRASSTEQSSEDKPTLESCGYDIEEYAEKLADWKAEQREKAREAESQKSQQHKSSQEMLQSYETKLEAFRETHPDFEEAVGSIDPKYLTPELQMAVLSHENGPALAYHLATNEDDLFDIASRRPELFAAALERLNQRLSAAPSPPTPEPEPDPLPAAPIKPISKAPAPTPTVAGRSPTTVDESKLTDEQWYARDKERRRKR